MKDDADALIIFQRAEDWDDEVQAEAYAADLPADPENILDWLEEHRANFPGEHQWIMGLHGRDDAYDAVVGSIASSDFCLLWDKDNWRLIDTNSRTISEEEILRWLWNRCREEAWEQTEETE